MKLEEQVCSLELAKKLKDMGVKQESAFYWFPFGAGEHRWHVTDKILDAKILKGWRYHDFFAAFTVAELGEMLPPDTPSDHGPIQARCWTEDSEDGSWHSDKADESGVEFQPHIIFADTEADARAKMLIYLIEKGLMKP